jgi:hypothetical protein
MTTERKVIEGIVPLPQSADMAEQLAEAVGMGGAEQLTQNQLARKHGIPKWLKRYNARYGRRDVEYIVAVHRQNPAPMLGKDTDGKA